MKSFIQSFVAKKIFSQAILVLAFAGLQNVGFAQWTTTGTDIHPTTTTNHVLIGTNSITDTKRPLLINSPNLGTGEFGGIALIGANEDIMWRTAVSTTANAQIRYNGSDLSLTSFGDDVSLNSQDDVEFYTNGGTLAATMNEMGHLVVRGRIDLQDGDVGNTAVNVNGAEAIWYDGDYFSWGFDGNWNRIADEVAIGAIFTEPAFMLDVAGDVNISGELTADSDRRLKKNIRALSGMTSKVMALNPVAYDFRTEEFPNLKLAERGKMGFIAQELKEVFPNLVSEGTKTVSTSGEEFDVLTVNYVELIPALTKSIQEQQELIDKLVDQLKKQDRRLAQLEGQAFTDNVEGKE